MAERDRATFLSVEILLYKTSHLKTKSPRPIVWHYLCDPIRLAVFTARQLC